MLQYIGARYVPIFYKNSLDPTSSEWEANFTYEPMTWVSLPNGYMYISKKTVPANIGTPAMNGEYWLEAGQYNAYIQSLQDQIDDMNDGSIPGSLQAQINTNASDISDINNTTIPAINSRIDNIEEDLYNKRFLVFGDSYDTYPVGHIVDGISYYNVAFQRLGINYQKITAGGYGFAGVAGSGSGDWIDLLNSATLVSPDEVTDVMFIGGLNDMDVSEANLHTAITNIISRCKVLMPNIKHFHIGCVGFIKDNNSSFKTRLRTTRSYYRSYCNQHQVNYMKGLDYLFNDLAYLNDIDGQGAEYHPNNAGAYALANQVVQYITNGVCDIEHTRRIVYSPGPNFTSQTGKDMIVHYTNDGDIIMNLADTVLIDLDTGWTAGTFKDILVTSGDPPVINSSLFTTLLFTHGSSNLTGKTDGLMLNFYSKGAVRGLVYGTSMTSTSDPWAILPSWCMTIPEERL